MSLRPYTPAHNFMVERDNRTVIKCAPSMLHYRSLPLEFLGKVVHNAVYSMCSIEFPTGLCMATHLVPSGTGPKPDVNHFKEIGSLCSGHIPN